MKNSLLLWGIILFSFLTFAQETDTIEVDTLSKHSVSPSAAFGEQMDDIFNDPNFANAHWGVIIQSLETGEYLYKRNEDKLFRPASNMKLFTSAAGLLLLGPEYKFTTAVYSDGEIHGSVLKGNLIVQGGGDPSFSGRFYNKDMFKVFNDWADSLINLGIDEITGNIIGDDNLFDNKGLGRGWAWDYESYWFSAPSGAISFNDNCVDIVVTVDNKTKRAKINYFPDTKYIVLSADVSVVPKDSVTFIDVYRERGTNIVKVSGTIRENSDSIKTFVTVNNPTQYSMVVLKETLERKGIIVKGYAVDIDDLQGLNEQDAIGYSKIELLFNYNSPPLKEIIKVINKNSQNFFAEQLLKTIGLEIAGHGTTENGVKSINEILPDLGINPESIKIVDGSGLSQLNLVSPRHIISLLGYMYKNHNFIPFFNSLPIAGVDGTLSKRMINTRAERNIRAKTGFLEYGRSLSGYAYTADNEFIAFSIMANNFTVPVKLAENIQDLVCLRLANFSRK